ncbi:MAG: ketopantoate reductase family protein, partial [bacterium]
PGVVRQTGGPRRVVFGELDGRRTARAETILTAFQDTGAPVELIDTIMVEMWEKYIFITAHGGMTALTRLPIGEIRETLETFALYLDAAEEVAAVGRASGVPIPDGQRERVRRFAESLEPGSRSSLYHDLTHGRRMELDALPGHVVRLGESFGIPTPVCRAIYAALKPYDQLRDS